MTTRLFLAFFVILIATKVVIAAPEYTPVGNINAVEEYGAGVRVYGLNLSGNPAGCNKTAIAFPSASARTFDEQNRLNSMLLASFVSQQRVRVKLSDTECRENQPVYLSVRIEN